MSELVSIFRSFRPIFILLGIVIGLEIIFDILLPNLLEDIRIKKKLNAGLKYRSDIELLHWLRSLNPEEFEEYIASLYSKLGYKTERVGGGYDGGVDVIAEKNNIKHYIQCKKYITSKVDVKDIREFYGVLVDHTAKGKGIFITTNVFTSEADYFAQDKPIELIDGQKLVRLIQQVK